MSADFASGLNEFTIPGLLTPPGRVSLPRLRRWLCRADTTQLAIGIIASGLRIIALIAGGMTPPLHPMQTM
jgi:hypothetical protein